MVFYYPAHFNRGGDNQLNEYIRPFIEVLNSAGEPYKIIEEPDLKTKYPRSNKTVHFDFWLIIILTIRKLLPLTFFDNFESREQWIGKLLKRLTFSSFRADVVMTLSNSMGGFWRGYNPNARIIDYQHGIINYNQPGFFENKKAPEHITRNKKEVAVWGEGFKRSLDNAGGYYCGKVHVLGYYKSIQNFKSNILQTDKILFSLQFLPEFGPKLNHEMLDHILSVLKSLESLPPENRPQVVLRNHPRHQNTINIDELIANFNFVKLMPENEELKPSDYALHATFFSTTAFEMAIEGIPSYFLSTANVRQGIDIFLEEYEYPISQLQPLHERWLDYCLDTNKWQADSNKVKEWSNTFFKPFDKQVLLELIKPLDNKGHLT